MPIYEYTCDDCHVDFEVLVRGDEQLQCPTCGSLELAKQLSVPAGHVSGASQLRVCSPPMTGGGCGLPQCGTGRCGME